MARFLKFNGQATKSTDPERMIWFSRTCTYWTDDWSKLKTGKGGARCCPFCRAAGHQAIAEQWFADIQRFEADDHYRYSNFVFTVREKCRPGKTFLGWYEEWATRRKKWGTKYGKKKENDKGSASE